MAERTVGPLTHLMRLIAVRIDGAIKSRPVDLMPEPAIQDDVPDELVESGDGQEIQDEGRGSGASLPEVDPDATGTTLPPVGMHPQQKRAFKVLDAVLAGIDRPSGVSVPDLLYLMSLREVEATEEQVRSWRRRIIEHAGIAKKAAAKDSSRPGGKGKEEVVYDKASSRVSPNPARATISPRPKPDEARKIRALASVLDGLGRKHGFDDRDLVRLLRVRGVEATVDEVRRWRQILPQEK